MPTITKFSDYAQSSLAAYDIGVLATVGNLAQYRSLEASR